jgi:hypothetical protein
MTREIEAPFGPDYPVNLGTAVAKFRRATKRGGLAALSKAERHAYGAAVEKAILALQRTEAKCGLPPVSPKVNCASGTAYNTGAEIHEAMRRKQRSALANCAAAERRARTPEQWRDMYDRAMKAKRQRECAPVAKTRLKKAA